jgi:hypothetical protein
MSGRDLPSGWGPRHQAAARRPRWVRSLIVLVAVSWILGNGPAWVLGLSVLCWIAVVVRRRWLCRRRGLLRSGRSHSLLEVRARQQCLGGGVYLGVRRQGLTVAPAEHAVLLLGPPDSVSHCLFRVRQCANSPVSD